MSEPASTGLAADPARRAHDSIRGYVYQILRSILVWIDLRDDEQLFLEGAEDLDKIDGASATTEQIKDTAASGSVTLRTASVVDAINNCWAHSLRNPDMQIQFRYVTTSSIGVEQGSPFGKNVGGLTVWNEQRDIKDLQNFDRVQDIADFLLANTGLSADVSRFLRSATGSELFDRVIRPIHWMSGQEDCAGLVRLIKDRLVIHGSSLQISPVDSEAAFDPLYTAAFDAAKSRDGVALSRAQFLRIFAASTGIHIPKQDLLAMVRAVANAKAAEPAILSSQMLLEGSPPLPDRYYRRDALETKIREALLVGTVLLHGSTGSGKTLGAASAFRSANPVWLPLRDLPPTEAKRQLLAAAAAVRAGAAANIVVVDDLDALSDPRIVEAALGSLWHCLETVGGKLVITSDRPLPARLAAAARVSSAGEIQMPSLDADEIDQFLRQSGCPPEMASVWSKVLEVSTSGHPQLVSVRVRTLAEKGFPAPDATDFFGNVSDLDGIKFEARRIIADLPAPARELLLRATLVTGRISRQRLLAIGRLQEAIVEPGIAVDTISGPWLEIADDGAFRVSPLARGAAEQLRGEAWSKSMHGQLAWIYLLDRTLSPWDISAILMHCLIAGSAGPLMHVLHGMFGADEETWAAVGRACEMYGSMALDSALPFSADIDVFAFRMMQHRIAAETDPEKAMLVAMKLDQELTAAPNDGLRTFTRFLYLSQVLSVTKVSYPLATVISRVFDFYDATKDLQTSFPERMARADTELGGEAGNYALFAAMHLFINVQNLDDFIVLLAALKTRAAPDVRALLRSLVEPDEMASVMIERLWLGEFEKENPRWHLLEQTLREAADFCSSIDATRTAQAMIPTILRTINEQLADSPRAIMEIDRLSSIIDIDAVCRCAVAKVTSDAGSYPEAREIWREAFPRWPKGDDFLGLAFALRSAAIAAGTHGDWLTSSGWFRQAKGAVEQGPRPTFTLGLAVDAAFAEYMAGNCDKAIGELGEVLRLLEPMQDDCEKEPLLSLQRRCAGVFAALVAAGVGELTVAELSRLTGFCSNLDPLVSTASVAPPIDVLRFDFLRLGLAKGGPIEMMVLEAERLRRSQTVSLCAASGPSLFDLAQRTLDFGCVVSDGLMQLDCLAMLKESSDSSITNLLVQYDGQIRNWPPSADELLISNLVIAVFTLAAANELDRIPLPAWRAAASAHPNAARVRAFIDHVEGLFLTATVAPWSAVFNPPSPDWAIVVTSALASVLLDPLDPDALLRMQAVMVYYVQQPYLKPLVAHYLAYLVTDQWRVRLEDLSGAGLDDLRSLEAAITGPAIGWAKTKAVLQAALVAFPMPDNEQGRDTINGIEA